MTPPSSEAKPVTGRRAAPSVERLKSLPQTLVQAAPETASSGNRANRTSTRPQTHNETNVNQEPDPLPASSRVTSLVISGSTYSDNPAHRMLIINGRFIMVSSQPELKPEQVRPKSALEVQRHLYVLSH
jgi:hypothetical protein